ncbi:ABC transporter permease [Mangrovicoccus sp. HB161399]|uniref:ABC transporter permease n=1 Tax=Mangrovicoccus sp. HB161399 TaxID=2720392 RepID=UPI00155528AB|nr:ABC transporter permease [Mangrovicoccus sp. HB161399]
MGRLILRRGGTGGLLVLASTLLLFLAGEMMPGDFASKLLGASATPETVEALRLSRGLDASPAARYLAWLGGLLHGDLGLSLTNGREIGALIASRLGNTLLLAGLAAAVAVPLALALGTLAAVFRDSWIDRAVLVLTMVTVATPEFFFAYVAIAVLAVELNWLPSISIPRPGMSVWEVLQVLVLPVLTLVVTSTAHVARMTRASIVAAMEQDYVGTAMLKGLPRGRIVLRHILPNVAAPVSAVVVMTLADIVVGLIIVETIFAYPGMGQLMVDSVAKRDITVVQACGLIFAATYIFLNMAADMLAIAFNPRLRSAR